MPVSAPTGIQARFAAGWAYLTVPPSSGAVVEVEAFLNDEWVVAHRYGSEYLVQMYADGSPTEWRARYVVGDQPGPWRTGRVAFPDSFIEDGGTSPDPDPGPKPDPDPGPTPDPVPGPPSAPRNVRAHCITDTSTKIEWDRDPTVMEYEVWIAPHRDAAPRTGSTLVTVSGLTQATEYTAVVVAHNAHGASPEGRVQFRTGVPEPEPDPDPDVDVDADWPAPELMVLPLEGGKVRATWTDPDDGTKPTKDMGYPYWHVSLDQKTWYFTKERQIEFTVNPDAQVMVSVYGVWDNTLTRIATKGVSL